MPEVIKNLSYNKGLNQAYDRVAIASDYAFDIQNIEIRNGILELSKGATRWSGFGNQKFNRLMKYYNGTVETLMGVEDYTKQLWVVKDNGGYTYLCNVANADIDYVNYQSGIYDVFIFTNGVDPVKMYNGADGTIKELKQKGANSDYNDATNRAPKTRLCEIHKERLWLAGDPTAPNRIYFSTANDDGFDIQDFTVPVDAKEANKHGGFFDLPDFSGGTILSIKSLFDAMIVFKKQHVFRIYGDSAANFGVSTLYSNLSGDIIDKTIQADNNKAFWVSTSGIFAFDGSNVKDMTPRVKNFFAQFTKTQIQGAVSTLFNKKYYVVINNKILIYDIEYDTFITRASYPQIFDIIGYKDMLLVSCDKKLLQLELGTNVDGTTMSAFLKGGFDNENETSKKKKSLRLDFIGSGDAVIDFSIVSEKATKTKRVTLSGTDKHYKVPLKNKGYTLAFEFSIVSGTSLNIKNLQLIVEVN